MDIPVTRRMSLSTRERERWHHRAGAVRSADGVGFVMEEEEEEEEEGVAVYIAMRDMEEEEVGGGMRCFEEIR